MRDPDVANQVVRLGDIKDRLESAVNERFQALRAGAPK
jgi:hypothetical protein